MLLGGWLSTRNQDQLWRRDHARQWRDIRLTTYRDFLTAYREYLAFTRDPNATISAIAHPYRPGTMMPFFDESGRPYVERLEAAELAARLVSEQPATGEAVEQLLAQVRAIAATRAAHMPEAIPAEEYRSLWAAESHFLATARTELGLPPMSQGAGAGLT